MEDRFDWFELPKHEMDEFEFSGRFSQGHGWVKTNYVYRRCIIILIGVHTFRLMFKAIDADNSGKISLGEFESFLSNHAGTLFSKADSDHDKQVTYEEYMRVHEEM